MFSQIGTFSDAPLLKSNNLLKDDFYCKLFTFSILMFISFPIIIPDLYYGYLHNHFKYEKFSINLNDFLLIRGWFSICSILMCVVILYFYDMNDKNIHLKYAIKRYNKIYNIFYLIWNIIGIFILIINYLDNYKYTTNVLYYTLFTILLNFISQRFLKLIFL